MKNKVSKLNDIFGGAEKVITNDESPMDMDFYRKNFGKIVVVIILLLGYIQLRYEYEDCLAHISALKKERNDVRYTSIEKWGILTLKNRPEVIRSQVANSQVDLKESDEPPVIIE